MKNMKINRTERGYAGHFIGSSSCRFRRNTLIEFGEKKVIISTVGNYQPHYPKDWKKSKYDNQIGYERTYETMAFEAKFEDPYWEADVLKEVPFESKWALSTLERETDKEADEMHEAVVDEIIKKLSSISE